MYKFQMPYAFIAGDYNQFVTSFENHYRVGNEYNQKPIVLLVAGSSCSGKTYFTSKLKEYWGDQVETICMDWYYRDDDDPVLDRIHEECNHEYGRFDMPDSYDLVKLHSDLRFLLSGYDIEAPIYDLSLNKRTDQTKTIKAGKQFYVVEGLYAFYLNDFCADEDQVTRVFVDARYGVRLGRRLERDSGKFANVTDEMIEWVFAHKTEKAFCKFDNHVDNVVDFYLETS